MTQLFRRKGAKKIELSGFGSNFGLQVASETAIIHVSYEI
jgi:hypothetical protein